MKTKVFVTGSKGLVGSRFVELYSDKYKLLTPEIDELDLTDKVAVKKFLHEVKPDVIIHFAAFTDVGEAEKQRNDKRGSCWRVNVGATKNLVDAIDPINTHFIHISTDMVFSGSEKDPGPYNEDHGPEKDSAKVTWYGWTKAKAEEVVRKKLRVKATILRLNYPVRAYYPQKLDYIRRPLSLFDEGKLYPMFTDQQVSISYIDEICTALDQIIRTKSYGTFHASSKDITSPFELISYVIEKTRGTKSAVQESKLSEFLKKEDNPVRYPKFGGLSVTKTEKKLGVKFSNWKEIVEQLIPPLP